jgi:thiol-disulfide isomerase/thioredoxin
MVMHNLRDKRVLAGVAILVIVIAAAYFFTSTKTGYELGGKYVSPQSSPQSGDSEKLTNVSEMLQSQGYTGEVLAGNPQGSVVLDFNKADYDRALASDKIILLYFYAEWCPICRAEVPNMYTAFNHRITADNVIAFRVNFNDGKTDDSEKLLANEFGVAYQHTKVILKDDKQVLKSPESWSEQRYVDEINKVVA